MLGKVQSTAALSPCAAVHWSIAVGKPVEAYWIKPYRKAPVSDLTGLRYDAPIE
jgi:hypothetical protein